MTDLASVSLDYLRGRLARAESGAQGEIVEAYDVEVDGRRFARRVVIRDLANDEEIDVDVERVEVGL